MATTLNFDLSHNITVDQSFDETEDILRGAGEGSAAVVVVFTEKGQRVLVNAAQIRFVQDVATGQYVRQG